MKVKDPVCGMTNEHSKAAGHGTYGTDTIYFCSDQCQKTYERTHPKTSG